MTNLIECWHIIMIIDCDNNFFRSIIYLKMINCNECKQQYIVDVIHLDREFCKKNFHQVHLQAKTNDNKIIKKNFNTRKKSMIAAN